MMRSPAGLASVAALGSTAGCLDSVPFVGSASGALEAIPESADALMYANTDTIREDDGVRTLTNTYLDKRSESDYYEGPEDFDEVLQDFQDESDIDPTKLHEITVFSEFGGSDYETFAEYGAAIIDADLTAENIKDSLANADDIDFQEATHSGAVVYEPDEEGGPWVGALPSNEIVVGTEDAVHDSIDVKKGDKNALSGELKEAYTSTRDAPFRFATRMPDPEDNESIPQESGSGDDSVDYSPLEDVDTIAGTVYKDGDTRGLEVTMNTADESAAGDVAEMLEDARDQLESLTEDGDAEDILADITIEQDGSSVTSSLERTISELEALIEDA
jgi:uncharacterized protein YjbJ (UPF0337 family)